MADSKMMRSSVRFSFLLMATIAMASIGSEEHVFATNPIEPLKVEPAPKKTPSTSAANPALNPIVIPSSNPSKPNFVQPAFPFPSFDFKRPSIPKSLAWPPQSRKLATPSLAHNVAPLLGELVRHQELSELSDQVMPFVYSQGSEDMVADFEQALFHLEIANKYLFDAFLETLSTEPTSFQLNGSLLDAKEHIDEAELTMTFLNEIARLDL